MCAGSSIVQDPGFNIIKPYRHRADLPLNRQLQKTSCVTVVNAANLSPRRRVRLTMFDATTPQSLTAILTEESFSALLTCARRAPLSGGLLI